MNVLFSTNVYAKYFVHKNFFNDEHYVWCSERFDSRASDPHLLSSKIGSTSDPKSIYEDYRKACQSKDRHHATLERQRTSLAARAVEWFNAGKIKADELDDIQEYLERADCDDFRPCIYVIPHALVSSRVELVPAKKRASTGREYIVPDLKGSEFQFIEGL